MPDEINIDRSPMKPAAIIGISLACGFGAGVLAFFAGFELGPIVYPESNLSGLSGIIWGPGAFVIVTFLVGLSQIRRVKTLPKGGGTGYGLFLSLFLLLSLYPAFSFFSYLLGRLKFG